MTRLTELALKSCSWAQIKPSVLHFDLYLSTKLTCNDFLNLYFPSEIAHEESPLAIYVF